MVDICFDYQPTIFLRKKKGKMTGVKRTFSRGRRTPYQRASPKKQRYKAKTTTGRPKRKRATSKKAMKRARRSPPGSRTPPQVRKHLSGFLNPFANTGGAKIPDGGSLLSMPLTHRIVQEIATGVTVPSGLEDAPINLNSQDGDIHILMYPGLQSGLIWAENPAGADQNEAPIYYRFTTDSYFSGEFSTANAGDVSTGRSADICRLKHEGGISKWRNVSQALRLSLLNTDQENDGWWESCRVAYKPSMTDWKIVFPRSSPRSWTPNAGDPTKRAIARISGGSFVADDGIIDSLEFRNMAEQKGYRAGSLKDIHTKQWDLTHQTGEHSFINTEEYYNLQMQDGNANASYFEAGKDATCLTPLKDIGAAADGQVNFNWNAVEVDGVNGSTAFKALFEDMTDFNQDMIFIRIHPGSTGARILAELACNQEVVYDLDSTLAKHQTPNDSIHAAAFGKAKDFKMRKNQMSANPKPMDTSMTF